MGTREMEMLLLPFHGQGHLFPFTQLALQLAAHGISVAIVVPSELTSAISSACDHPLVRVAPLSFPPSPPDDPPPHPFLRAQLMAGPFSDLLANRTAGGPVCVVVDALVGWAIQICQKHSVPSVVFFTNGTCACALEYVGYHLPEDTNPEEPISIAGLPDSLRLIVADLIAKPPSGQMPPPPTIGGPSGGPPMTSFGPPARRKIKFPPWVPEVAPAMAFLFNTCDELEKPFIECLARESGKKAFGVGPLLPRQFLESARGAPIRDGAVRAARKESSVSEEEVAAWLDSKPPRSVVFVSFGSEVSPSAAELVELAAGLEESRQPFIWVIQANSIKGSGPPQLGIAEEPNKEPWLGVVPEGFEKRVQGRGLIIRGWAPQLLILSHGSTGGFLSHCGWNSTLESLACGVPLLAWPIRGDQHQTTILVERHLRVGFAIRGGRGRAVTKDDVVRGMAKLMGDEEVGENAAQIKAILAAGFPASSSASLDAFISLFSRR